MNSLTVVAPFHNESAHVAPCVAGHPAVLAGVEVAWTVICVNDGSTDDTLALLLAAHEGEGRIKVIDLSRNFGKGYALTAGLDHCRAEAVVLINSDLQHPPELLPAMIAKFREGFENISLVPTPPCDVGLAHRLAHLTYLHA